MSKIDILEDILLHFDLEEITLNAKQICGLIEALDLNATDVANIDPLARQFIVDHLFNDKEANRYLSRFESQEYFATTLARHLG